MGVARFQSNLFFSIPKWLERCKPPPESFTIETPSWQIPDGTAQSTELGAFVGWLGVRTDTGANIIVPPAKSPTIRPADRLYDMRFYSSFERNWFDVNAYIIEADGSKTNAAVSSSGFKFNISNSDGKYNQTGIYDYYHAHAYGTTHTITVTSAPSGTQLIGATTRVATSYYFSSGVNFEFKRT